jgi:hypothetical protein
MGKGDNAVHNATEDILEFQLIDPLPSAELFFGFGIVIFATNAAITTVCAAGFVAQLGIPAEIFEIAFDPEEGISHLMITQAL